MSLAPGEKLGRYEIEVRLGAGGMGEVYAARDTQLQRRVAVKILAPDRAADRDARARFEREARAAASLSHPHILAIYDFGVEAGTAFVVTELLEGETLGTSISRSALPWRQAVGVARALAEGLAAAHARGIIHRDLKPENVFLTADGQVKILDFGLARVESLGALTSEASTQTADGTILGTVGYMSPEQIRGETADARSDIFSLGCVLYEMVAGRRAFQGSTTAESLAAILRDTPRDLVSVGVTVPPPLERVIAHCLEKSPHQRFQSALDLAFDLRALDQGSDISAAAEVSRLASGVDSVAVLPFDSSGAGPDAEFLGQGLADGLIDTLLRLSDLRVTARSLSSRFGSQAVDPREAGRVLGVQAVVVGRVVERADRLVVDVELIDAQTGARLWGERLDRAASELPATSEALARGIAERLRPKLSSDERRRAARKYSRDSEAYRLYLKGRYFWNRRPRDTRKAVEFFRQAIEADPLFALAYAGLSDCYATMSSWEAGLVAPREGFPRAKAAARKAMELEEGGLAEAETPLAYSAVHYDWDLAAGEKGFLRALELEPNYAHAHHWYSHMLVAAGRFPESLAESKRALELDPLDTVMNFHLAWHYWIAREPREAIAQSHRTLELDPGDFWSPWFLAVSYAMLGEHDRSVEEHRRAVERSRSAPVFTASLAHALAGAGDEVEARSILGDLQGLRSRQYVSAYGIALIHSALGETDKALEWLGKAVEERDAWLAYLEVEPRLDSLRPDPRFSEIRRCVGLATTPSRGDRGAD
jgi:TolB-like protein/Tfp pilus assembly protein PilF